MEDDTWFFLKATKLILVRCCVFINGVCNILHEDGVELEDDTWFFLKVRGGGSWLETCQPQSGS